LTDRDQNRAYAVSQLQDLQAKLNKAKSTIPNTRASVPISSTSKAAAPADAKGSAKRKDTADEGTKGRDEQKNESALLKGVRDR
jgi:COP9 signalosome complex subunit 5